MTEYDQIADALDDLEHVIAATRTAIAVGDMVDLDGLPEFADSVCRRVTDLPDDVSRLFGWIAFEMAWLPTRMS